MWKLIIYILIALFTCLAVKETGQRGTEWAVDRIIFFLVLNILGLILLLT
jgi:hypothetical protein